MDIVLVVIVDLWRPIHFLKLFVIKVSEVQRFVVPVVWEQRVMHVVISRWVDRLVEEIPISIGLVVVVLTQF